MWLCSTNHIIRVLEWVVLKMSPHSPWHWTGAHDVITLSSNPGDGESEKSGVRRSVSREDGAHVLGASAHRWRQVNSSGESLQRGCKTRRNDVRSWLEGSQDNLKTYHRVIIIKITVSYTGLDKLKQTKALTILLLPQLLDSITILHITVYILHSLRSIPAGRLFMGAHMLIKSHWPMHPIGYPFSTWVERSNVRIRDKNALY